MSKGGDINNRQKFLLEKHPVDALLSRTAIFTEAFSHIHEEEYQTWKEAIATEEARKKAAAEAEARAKADAERAKQQAEAARANATVTVQGDAQKAIKDAEKTKSEMLFPEDQQTYKRTCNREALEDIKACGIDEEKAKAIVTAIVKGKVRHIVMMY